MKKLSLNQMYKLVDFLSDCSKDYEDDYSKRAVNKTLEILGYSNEFQYDYENDGIICDGGIELPETDELQKKNLGEYDKIVNKTVGLIKKSGFDKTLKDLAEDDN